MNVTQEEQKQRAAVYLRKSSIDDRPGENRSFARQMTDITKIISEFSVVAEFQEEIGISASRFSNQERPEWERALAGLGYDYDVLVAAQADRLDREGIGGLVKILDACEQGTKGRVITSEWDSASSEARLLGPIIFELARAESEKIHLRVTAAKEVQKAKLDWLGGTYPFCWDITRDDQGVAQYRIIPERQAQCIEAATRYIEGDSYGRLSAWSNQRGFKTGKGKAFKAQTWRQILNHTSMAGHREMCGELITDENGEAVQFADPILPPDLHALYKAEAIRRHQSPSGGGYQAGRRGGTLLAKVITCSDCGHNLSKMRNKYRCMAENHERQSVIDMAGVDDLVGFEVMKFIGGLEPGSKLSIKIAQQVQRHFNPADRSRRAQVEAKLVEINERLRILNKKFLVGDIESRDFSDLETTANTMKNTLVAELGELPAPATDLADLLDWDQETGLIGEGSFWQSLSREQKRDVIISLIETIQVDPRFISNRKPENVDELSDRVHIEWLHESNVTELKPRKPAANTTKVAQAS